MRPAADRAINYTQLRSGFTYDYFTMLVNCSRGGIGESEEVCDALAARDIGWIGGHVTPLKLYELLRMVGIARPVQ